MNVCSSHGGMCQQRFQRQAVGHGTSDATHGEMVVEMQQSSFVVDDGVGPTSPRMPQGWQEQVPWDPWELSCLHIECVVTSTDDSLMTSNFGDCINSISVNMALSTYSKPLLESQQHD